MKRSLLSLLLVLLLTGCVDADQAPEVTPEQLPDDVSAWTYVAVGVSASAADGSALNPYPSVQAAIDAAEAGGGVLIEAGTYDEALTIDKDLVLSGLPTASEEVILKADAASQVLAISGGAVVRIEDLQLSGNQDAVVAIEGEGTSAKLTDLVIECAPLETVDQGEQGHGLVVTDGAHVAVNGGKIHGCAMYGVFVDSAKLILDQMSVVSDHGAGGIRLEAALAGSEIRSAVIEKNKGFGVGLFCGELSIINSEITQTANPGGGDGVVAAVLTALSPEDPRAGCTTDLVVGGEGESQGNTIESNQRAGVLIDGDVASRIQNNRLNYNGNGGIWLVGDASSQSRAAEIFQNKIWENLHVGVGVVNRAIANIGGNQVWDTEPIDDFSGETSHGDGIFVEEAESAVYTNSLRNNLRYGILMREPVLGSCIGDDNTYEANMQSHKWEHAQNIIDPCAQTWEPDDPCELDENEECLDEEIVKKPPELACDSPTCLSDPTNSLCPEDCGASKEPPSNDTDGPDALAAGDTDIGPNWGGGGPYPSQTTLDCSGCFGGEGPQCPNDGIEDENDWPCCKPNSMEGLGVDNHSASSDES